MGNRKLESRVESLRKSRLLLDRINEALTVLKKKPGNGPRLYELIYLTYIVPEKLSHTDLLFRLDLSSRQYYRLREEAISILSIRLWSVRRRSWEDLWGWWICCICKASLAFTKRGLLGSQWSTETYF